MLKMLQAEVKLSNIEYNNFRNFLVIKDHCRLVQAKIWKLDHANDIVSAGSDENQTINYRFN